MNEPERANIAAVLSPGTQVVCLVEARNAAQQSAVKRGAVGVVVASVSSNRQPYLVRFADGTEAELRREEIAVRKEHQRGWLESACALDERNLRDYVIYRCVVGSRAYGLANEESDTDRRGVYLPPADMQWAICGVPEQLESLETEECYWELQKFLTLALKANPNILECLYTPEVEMATPLAQEMLAMRQAFLSQIVYQTYNGYVMSQFRKIAQDLRNGGAIKWKHAMHLIRLLLSGVEIMREGTVPIRVEAHRAELLAIRNGEVSWDELDRRRLALHKEFDEAYGRTRLPGAPDYQRVNAFLLKARRSMVDKQ